MKTKFLLCALAIVGTCVAQNKTVNTSKDKFDDGTTVTIHSVKENGGKKYSYRSHYIKPDFFE